MKSKVRYCDLCGERLDANDKFCKGCGNVNIKDKDAPDAIIEDPKGGSNTTHEVNNNLIIALLTILAIVIAFFLMF